jgi:4-hydroxy-tetrahydrodipicolinate synthase
MVMRAFQIGLAHTPVTPFTRERRIDFDTFGKLIDFHLRNGADSLALPMHAGESVSLADEEKRSVIEFAVERARGRVPVIAHVSDAGTGIAAALAHHAEQAGAAAIVATTPYYWAPPPAMLLEHFAQIGSAVRLPFFVHNAPDEMGGVKVTTELVLKLIERLENFAGVVDSGLDWQFLIEVVSEARRARPEFQLISGVEYVVSAGAIGGSGAFSALAAIAPRLVRRLHELCRDEKYFQARKSQEDVAELRQILKPAGVAGLKAALRAMGRDCGEPRPPLRAAELGALPALRDEPRGW